MKIITQTTPKDTISLQDITRSHLVVAVHKVDGRPYIVSRRNYDEGNFCLASLKSQFTNGNCIDYAKNYDNLQDFLKHVLKFDYEVEVFDDKDWDKALLWLVENSKNIRNK